MKQGIKNAAVAFGLSAAGILSATALAPAAVQSTKNGAPRAQSSAFAIENMTCPACPITVKQAMQGVKGVRSVDIDFAAKKARVVFDPKQTNAAAIAAASTNAGYPAKPAR